jgi:hypothetical protein
LTVQNPIQTVAPLGMQIDTQERDRIAVLEPVLSRIPRLRREPDVQVIRIRRDQKPGMIRAERGPDIPGFIHSTQHHKRELMIEETVLFYQVATDGCPTDLSHPLRDTYLAL